MAKKQPSEFQPSAGLSGLFAEPEADGAPPSGLSTMQARLLALYPAGRRLRAWSLGRGWQPCRVVSARPELQTVVVVVEGEFGMLAVMPCDLKPDLEAEQAG